MLKRVLVVNNGDFFGSSLIKRLMNVYPLVVINNGPLGFGLPVHSVFIQADYQNFEAIMPTVKSLSPDTMVVLSPTNYAFVRAACKTFLPIESLKSGIFMSSADVIRPGHWPKNDGDVSPISEDAKKIAYAERIWRHSTWSEKSWTILRAAPLWGPEMPKNSLLYSLLTSIHSAEKCRGFEALKSFCYVGNAAYQVSKIIEHEDGLIHNKTIFLADYLPVSLTTLCTAFFKQGYSPHFSSSKTGILAGKAKRLLHLNRFPFLKAEQVLDVSMAKLLCGELPYSYQDGVSHTLTWLKHPETFLH
jgi:nucleoside-diphosphate-sugar epimerase